MASSSRDLNNSAGVSSHLLAYYSSASSGPLGFALQNVKIFPINSLIKI